MQMTQNQIVPTFYMHLFTLVLRITYLMPLFFCLKQSKIYVAPWDNSCLYSLLIFLHLLLATYPQKNSLNFVIMKNAFTYTPHTFSLTVAKISKIMMLFIQMLLSPVQLNAGLKFIWTLHYHLHTEPREIIII